MTKTVVVTTSASEILARRICDKMKARLEVCRPSFFADGNMWVQLREDYAGRDVLLVQTLYGSRVHEDLVCLLFLADALDRAGAAAVDVLIPYFSYAKADKMDGGGTSERGQVVAGLIATAHFRRILIGNLHSPQATDWWQGKLTEIKLQEVLINYLRAHGLSKKMILVAPDDGARAMVAQMALALGVDYMVASKKRVSLTGDPEIILPAADVHGLTAVIVDDFVTSGGTLMKTAGILRERGASDTLAAVIHAPINDQARVRLEKGALTRVITTNTTRTTAGGKIEVVDVSGVVVGEIQKRL